MREVEGYPHKKYDKTLSAVRRTFPLMKSFSYEFEPKDCTP